MNFEEKLKKLEEISELLQEENQTLEQSINSFEEGMKLSLELEKELNIYEKRVQILLEKDNTDYLEDFK